jgi:transcriptional regulator GlxA family with amidase domain
VEIDISPKMAPAQLHAVFIVVPRFNITTLITMIETMRVANYLAPVPIFSWEIASFDGTKITASNGMTTTVKAADDTLQPAKFVFVLGSWGTEHYANKHLITWLRKRARARTRICGVELGCYIVARAGLLDGKPATIHWSWLNGFRETFDRIDVREGLFTLDSKVMTCAGGLAGVDLMLRLIEELQGSSFSGEIADQMLHHPIRNAATPQRSTMGRSTETMLPLPPYPFGMNRMQLMPHLPLRHPVLKRVNRRICRWAPLAYQNPRLRFRSLFSGPPLTPVYHWGPVEPARRLVPEDQASYATGSLPSETASLGIRPPYRAAPLARIHCSNPSI